MQAIHNDVVPKHFCPTRVQSAQQITFAQQLDNNVLLLGKNNPHVGQIQPLCWAKPANTTCTVYMLGKYCPHVGQILPTCWANTALMLGRFRPLLDTMVCTRGFISFSAPGQLAPSKYLPALKTSIVTVD